MKKIITTLILAMGFILLCGFSPNERKDNPSVVDLETTEETVTEDNGMSKTSSTEDGITSSTSESPNNNSSSNNGSEEEGGIFGNNSTALPDDYKFGDDLLPKVNTENFFVRLYKKLFDGLNVVQTIISILLIFLFVFAVFRLAVSLFATKTNIGFHFVVLIIIAILYIVNRYAVQIISVFSHWFTS